MAQSAPSLRSRQWRFTLVACLALLAASPAWALGHVMQQLKWKHQFNSPMWPSRRGSTATPATRIRGFARKTAKRSETSLAGGA